MCRAYTPSPESICCVLFFNYVAAFICKIFSPNACGSLLRPAGSVSSDSPSNHLSKSLGRNVTR